MSFHPAAGVTSLPAMANRDNAWKRYLDVGAAAMALTQSRAEAIVKDLVKAGEVNQDRAQRVVEELVARSRRNTDEMMRLVRREVQDQLRSLGLATRADLERLEARVSAMASKARPAKATSKARPAKATASGTTPKRV